MLSGQTYSCLMALLLFFSSLAQAKNPNFDFPPIIEKEVLIDFDVLWDDVQPWHFWLSSQAPNEWPLQTMPSTAKSAISLIAEKQKKNPDRLLYAYDNTGKLKTDGVWWRDFPAPFSVRSAVKFKQLLPKRLKKIRKNLKKRGYGYSRTEFVTSVTDGPNTVYFAKAFTVENPADLSSFQIEAKFHQGIILYLNGKELARRELPKSGVSHETLAMKRKARADFIQMDVGASDRWQWAWTGFSADLLKKGENVIAVELHKGKGDGNPAIYFDLKLTAYKQFGWLKYPFLQTLREDGLWVGWETNLASTGVVEVLPVAGPNPEKITFASSSPQTFHELNVTGLQPDTKYKYRVVTTRGKQTSSTTWAHFTTAPPKDTPFQFLLYGDSRAYVDVHRKLADMMKIDAAKMDHRFVVHTGDIVSFGYRWELWQENFFRPSSALLQTVPIYPAIGNHEVNQQLYYDYFALPHNESWYSFSYGYADFFSLNSNINMSPKSEQYKWFEKELQASKAPWKIVFLHHPPYSCSPSRKPGHGGVRKHLVPLMEKYGVQLVLLGHDHLYGKTRDINGVVYVTSGGGGSPLYPGAPDEYSDVCIKAYNYVRFSVTKDEIDWEAIDIDGNIIDVHTLTNPNR